MTADITDKIELAIVGSRTIRMMEVGYMGFMDDEEAVDLKYHWFHVMVVDELKKSQSLITVLALGLILRDTPERYSLLKTVAGLF
jgi:hypothetical protein